MHAFLLSCVNHLKIPSCFSQDQWKKLDTMVASIMCRILQINHHFPRKLLYNKKYGYNIPSFWDIQGNAKLTFFVSHLRMKTKMGYLLHIQTEYAQIESGSLTQIWKLDYTKYYPIMTNT